MAAHAVRSFAALHARICAFAPDRGCLRTFENCFRDHIADRVGASGKPKLDTELVKHKGHEVNVFLIEWCVLKNAVGRHRTSVVGPKVTLFRALCFRRTGSLPRGVDANLV